MNAGDTFFIRGEEPVEHLWVIVSDPEIDAQKVLIVHITTFEEYKEDVCLLDVGDHPRIQHPTCIAYDQSRVTSLAKLHELSTNRQIVFQAPMHPKILERIRSGANDSQRIHHKHLAILEDQGLIEF
jgi:hypothetical protein